MSRGWMRRLVLSLLCLVLGAGGALAGTSKYTLTKEDIKRAEKRLVSTGVIHSPDTPSIYPAEYLPQNSPR